MNHRLEKESEKLLITTCISKLGSAETIEIVLNFDKKDWPHFVDEKSYLEDLLEDIFLQIIGIQPANLCQWKFDSLVVFLLKKKHE